MALGLLVGAARGQGDVEALGGIRGAVYDAEFGGPVPDVTIQLLELDVRHATGADGLYAVPDVPAGAYTLVFSKPGYERQVRAAVVVPPGGFAEVTIELAGEFAEMEELVVRELEMSDTATEAGLLTLRESSLSLQDSVSRELMSKAGASDAAGALRLVVGASVVDGKFASVRGLSDRYVGTAMNGLRLPSSDPKKRAVHLDIFPAGTIESISVSKTFTPDLPGDYTGGGVNIRTIGIPDESFVKAGFTREHNRDYTGKDEFITYEGGGVGRWGRHMGERNMPAGADTMFEDGLTEGGLESRHDARVGSETPHDENYRSYNRITRSFAPAMGVERTRVPQDYSYSASAGLRGAPADDWTAGGLLAFAYSLKHVARDSLEVEHAAAAAGDPPIEDEIFDQLMGSEDVKWSMLASAGLAKEDQHEYTLTYMRNRAASDRASLRIEEHDAATIPVGGFWQQRQAIHYTERSVDALQLRGEHRWEDLPSERLGLRLNWYGAHNLAEQEEPDVRAFRNVVVNRGSNTWEYQFRPDGASGADSDSSTRIWRNTREDNSLYGADLTIPFDMPVADLHRSFLGLGTMEDVWTEAEAEFKVGANWDWTRRFFVQDTFFYTFGQQLDPTDTGPQRSEFPPGPDGQVAFEEAREAWTVSPEGVAYRGGVGAAERDRELSTYTTNRPNALYTDVFTDPSRLGVGPYQNSMRWYVLPKSGDVDYDGIQNFNAGYWMLALPVTKQLKFIGGARLEYTEMRVDPTSDIQSQTPERAFQVPVENVISNADGTTTVFYTLEGVPQEEAVADIREASWLRSMGFVYELDPGMNLRASWSQTIARPTFLELAPVITYDYVENEAFIGNQDLQIATIENWDLRWEWFYGQGEVASFSVFKKRITDPIEKVSFGYLGEDYLLAVNYPSGVVRGWEAELRKNLDFLPAPFHLFKAGANYTLIDATVKIPEEQRPTLSLFGLDQEERDMEGQPAYLLNLSLSYDIEKWGTSVNWFYVETGDVLKSGAAVGDPGATPDIYTLARPQVNLGISQKIGALWKVDLRAKNLTDQQVEEVYRYPDGREITRRAYTEGVSYSFSLGGAW